MFQVTQAQIVRFLLGRAGLRFRNLNLGVRGHDLIYQTATCNARVPIYPEGLAFVPPFLDGHHDHDGAFKFVCHGDQDLAPW